MLRFTETQFPTLFSGTAQVVNFSADEQALLNAGRATLLARAVFNRVPGHAETDTRFLLRVSVYPGQYPLDWTPNQPPLRFITTQLLTDSDPTTWEEALLELNLGALSQTPGYALIDVLSAENIHDDQPPAEFDGHYVDDVRVMIKPR